MWQVILRKQMSMGHWDRVGRGGRLTRLLSRQGISPELRLTRFVLYQQLYLSRNKYLHNLSSTICINCSVHRPIHTKTSVQKIHLSSMYYIYAVDSLSSIATHILQMHISSRYIYLVDTSIYPTDENTSMQQIFRQTLRLSSIYTYPVAVSIQYIYFLDAFIQQIHVS